MLDFVVIGAQKAGSTFLLQCLEEHPEIFMVHSEVPFFQDPDYSPDGLERLLALFRNQEKAAVRGLKRPNYLGDPLVPGRIARHFPRVKLLALLRNPIERTISAYFHYMQSGFIPVIPFERGLEKIIGGTFDSRYPGAGQIIEYSLYATHIERYLSCFDREQLFIQLFEQLRDNPVELVRETCRFVGVSDDYTPLRPNRRPMAAVYSLPRLRLGAMVQPLTTVYYQDRTRMRFRGWGGHQLSRIYSRIDRYLLERLFPSKKPSLSPALRDRLNAVFRDDTNRLREILDHPLPGWPS